MGTGKSKRKSNVITKSVKLAIVLGGVGLFSTSIVSGGTTASASTTYKTYTVKSGDTLGGIAQKSNVGLTTILKLNHLESTSYIYVGQKLKLKKTTKPKINAKKATTKTKASTTIKTKKTAKTTGSKTTTTSVYRVKSGDTLSGIATKYNISLTTLLNMNNLKSTSVIRVGQEIQVKKTSVKKTSKPSTKKTSNTSTKKTSKGRTSTYTIKSGDTLSGIAYKYGLTLSKLLSMNNLTSNSIIHVGQSIHVSGGTSKTTSKTTSKKKPTTSTKKKNSISKVSNTLRTYTVKSGDSLSLIASKNGMTMNELMTINGITSTSHLLRVGDTLKISGGKSGSTSTKPVANKPVSNGYVNGYSAVTGAKILHVARQYIGVPYVYGGSSTSGIDCSGLLYAVYNKVGISVPRTTAEGFYYMAKKVTTPKAGDLVFFKDTYKSGISHVGFVIDDRYMLDASGKETKIESYKASYWASHFAGYGRIN